MPKAFIVGCKSLTLEADERSFFAEADPLGLILFKRNVESREQLAALTQEFRAAVGRDDAPVLIDQEGGRVQRLTAPHWRAYPAAQRFLAELPRERALEAVRLVSRLIAYDLLEVGITVDCAPVLDVAEAQTHAVIGSRSFGVDPADVAAAGRAAVEGFLAGGVLPVIKHIPGHGRARADSHLELPRVEASRAELSARDFAPFRALADAPAAMTAHVVFADIDPDQPATQSRRVIEDVIRDEIRFVGLLISDDLSMKALAGPFAARAAAAFDAGVDIALHCNGDLNEAAAVAEASPPLASYARARWERAQGFVSGGAGALEPGEAVARLQEIWPGALA